jgi:sec-independent protein translocase protein TatA
MNAIILGIIGPGQILIVAIVVILLIGGKKIPELMRGMGEGVKEFKKSTKTDKDDISKD